VEPVNLIKKFSDFFIKFEAELLEKARTGKDFIVVSFYNISKYDPELVDELLDKPEETFRAMELAIEGVIDKKIKIIIKELPPACKLPIRNLRSKHLEKLWVVEGTVQRKTDVRPKITVARFECPSCGNVISIIQMEKKFKEPSGCGCGRKGKFRLLNKDLVDAYSLVIEELTEYVKSGSELKRLNCFVSGPLTDPKFESKIFPGIKVKLTGILKPFFKETRPGIKKTQLDIYFDVNNIKILGTEYEDITITKKDKEDFHEMVKSGTVLQELSDAMFSAVEGYENIKKGIILQLAGGEQKKIDGYKARGDIHILLIGDPGAGKSTLLKLAIANAPKARYVAGGGASGVGLTAAVVRDEMMGGFALAAGALPLTHNGLCAIDEFDKISKDDMENIHEALEEQTVTISKANIQATLRAETSVLSAANPKYGRFDINTALYNQIDLPPALITRNDLIFLFLDKPDEEKDKKTARKILSRYRVLSEPPMPKKKIKKFFAYAKQFHPTTNKKIENIIVDFYVKLRNPVRRDYQNQQSVPISPRYIEVIRRLSEAHAKINLRDRVEPCDVQVAIDLVLSCLKDIAINPETGQLDVDIIDTGYSATGRSKRVKFLEIITQLSKDHNDFSHEEIINKGLEFDMSEIEIEEIISKAKLNGEIFEPKPGFYSKI